MFCSPSFSIVWGFLSYHEHFARISMEHGELIERFFYTLRFPSRDRFHSTLVRPRLYFAVIYLSRIAGARIIAYYRSFIDQYTIHSLCCLALWYRLLYRRSFSISSDFALFRRSMYGAIRRVRTYIEYSVTPVINKYATLIAEIVICSIYLIFPTPSISNGFKSRKFNVLSPSKIGLAKQAIFLIRDKLDQERTRLRDNKNILPKCYLKNVTFYFS